eukprot:2622867-Pleurochrysis_carterae.AAC.1
MGTPDDVLDTDEIGQRSNVKDQIPDNFNYPSVEFKEASICADRDNENEINQVVDQLIQDVEKRQSVASNVQNIFDRVLENARNAEKAENARLEKIKNDQQVSRLTRSLVDKFKENLSNLVKLQKEEQEIANQRTGTRKRVLRSDRSLAEESPTRAKAMGKAITLELMLTKLTPAQRATLLDTLILETEEVLQGPENSSTDFSLDEIKLEELRRLRDKTAESF